MCRRQRLRRSLIGRALTVAVIGCGVFAGAEAAAPTPATLKQAPILPDGSLEHLTRSITRSELGKDLFDDPAASAMVGQVEILDRYPYVHTRYVQLVTDARWNRVVFAENGYDIHAWTGAGSHLGALSAPQGIDRDPFGRIFIADSGNDRVVVAVLNGEGAALTLEPLYEITGLSRPAGVAWDGGGTPLDTSDDHVWVADTGNHRVVCFAVSENGPSLVATCGERGNQPQQFLEPRDVSVMRPEGAEHADVYVADWGNGRVARLRASGGHVTWHSSRQLGTDLRSVATDLYGNVYAALREDGRIVKLDADLEPIFDSGAAFPGVRDLSVGFLTVTDHRSGERHFTGYGSLTAVEHWSDQSGAKRLELGAEAIDLRVAGDGGRPTVDFMLTDHAEVEVRVLRGSELVRAENLGTLAAGRRQWQWDALDQSGSYVGAQGLDYEIRVASLYEGGAETVARTGAAQVASVPAFLEPAWPNPANPATHISFFVPDTREQVRLEIIDVTGRIRQRLVDGAMNPGRVSVEWDGTDAAGQQVSSGVYLVRLRVGAQTSSQKLTVVR